MKLHPNKLLNPWALFFAWTVLWAARLRLIPDYYQRTWELGYYPPEADSIAIAIASHGMITIGFAPFFAIGLWLLLRRSPVERRTWLVWNRQRWVLSLIWTVLFGLFALDTLPDLVGDARIRLPFNMLADAGWFILWLAVRAVVVSRISPRQAPGSSPNNPLPATAPVPGN